MGLPAALLGLLADCKDHPEEDAPRLVLADWLDDHGEADRAEFVRAQVELARLDEDDPRRPALLARERGLLERHVAAWVGGVGMSESWVFRRGLLHLTLDQTTLSAADTRAGPWSWVEQVQVRRVTPRSLERLGDSPLLARLRTLDLSDNGLKLAGARDLADCPWVANLHTLDLGRNNVG